MVDGDCGGGDGDDENGTVRGLLEWRGELAANLSSINLDNP